MEELMFKTITHGITLRPTALKQLHHGVLIHHMGAILISNWFIKFNKVQKVTATRNAFSGTWYLPHN